MQNMTKKSGNVTSGISEPPSYVDLLIAFPPRTIKSEEELDVIQEVIDGLIDKGDLTSDERDYLNLLGTLVYEYEEEHYPIPDIHGVELLKVLLIERDLRQKDLIPVFKTESVVSSVLSGQRKLTANHIQKLGEFFHISPAVFFPAVK